MIVALIPARGGSKGIPRKNLVDLGGKPLIAWTIEAAIESREIDRVIVSSDSGEIGRTSEYYGAEWLRRPREISGDAAPTETAISHAIDSIDKADIVVLLQPTSPLRQPHDIDQAIKAYREADADSLFSACHVEGFTWRVNGQLVTNYDFKDRPRRQDLTERVIEENGSIYVFSPQMFRREHCRLGGRIAWYEQSQLCRFQIDTPDDLEIARAMLPAMTSSVRAPA